MDPLTRKLFQPREAREKLRGMGGIMSSSPQLASTVAKFQQGGPIQSRGLVLPSAPDSPLPSAGPARATRVGDRTFVLTDDGRVLDAQTGAPAPQEVAAEVMRRLSPQLSMADIVGAAPDFSGGVNPSFREDTSGQLPPMPSDRAPMSAPADPTAELYARTYSDLLGPTEGPLAALVSGAETPAETAPSGSLTFSEGLSNRPGIRGLGDRVVDDIRFTADAVMSPLTGASQIADDEMLEASRRSAEEAAALRDAQGITESLGRPRMDRGPAAGLETISQENLLPPERDQDGNDGNSQAAPTENLDPNDPATFDTTYDQMLTRLQSVMGTKDEDSRQKAMANLAMIGLAIASGQSPDALTNIAQGALTGVKAIREEQAAGEEQDKALRMAALNAALEMEQGTRSAEASAARDELKFQRDLQLEQEKARLGVGRGGRNPRAIEDVSQDSFEAAFAAASSASPPVDMAEGETPSAYAERIARGTTQLQQIMFPETYGANTDILNTVRQALESGLSPDRVRQDFLTAYPGADPSYYGL